MSAQGSWLVDPEDAPEKNPVSSYQECDLGGLIGKLYCNSLQNVLEFSS